MTDDLQPDVAQERAALVTHRLSHGAQLTIADIVVLCNMTRQGAAVMMCNISRVTPIVCICGVWQELDPTKKEPDL